MTIPTLERETGNAVTAINLVALKERKSADEVRQSIKVAVLLGMLNENPEVRKKWQSIPCEKEYPEPEEVIEWISNLVRQTRFDSPMPEERINPAK